MKAHDVCGRPATGPPGEAARSGCDDLAGQGAIQCAARTRPMVASVARTKPMLCGAGTRGWSSASECNYPTMGGIGGGH